MNAVLTKPFTANKLIDIVGEQLFTEEEEATNCGSAAAPGRKLVLIVDDNAMNQRVAKAIVEKGGYESVTVEDGQLAVDYLREERCDLVLMDCQMPVLDGWEATRVIRELESLGRLSQSCRKPLPIIAVTANAMDGDREKCLEAGMDDHMPKPIKPKVLLAAIADRLKKEPAAAGR
jgi:polar amino acid transport system substrate-binding protein